MVRANSRQTCRRRLNILPGNEQVRGQSTRDSKGQMQPSSILGFLPLLNRDGMQLMNGRLFTALPCPGPPIARTIDFGRGNRGSRIHSVQLSSGPLMPRPIPWASFRRTATFRSPAISPSTCAGASPHRDRKLLFASSSTDDGDGKVRTALQRLARATPAARAAFEGLNGSLQVRMAACRLSMSSPTRLRRNSRKSGMLSMPPTGALHRKLSISQFGSSQGFTAKGGGTMRHMLP